jgi:xanthine dehydrogenase YagS FAD-binding subunit
MCVALAALEANVHVTGPFGKRVIAFEDFHRLPDDMPHLDNNLAPQEIVTAIELPPKGFAANHSYLKIRDRLSYAFALVSVAAALEIDGGRIKEARLALGGVAHKPWRDKDVEAALRGKAPDRAAFAEAADMLLKAAKGFAHNAFKIGLARRAIIRTLTQAANATPQVQSSKKIR